jgi:hypothetical protein
MTSRRAASLVAMVLLLVPAVAAMACSKTYGHSEEAPLDEAGLPLDEAGPGTDAPVIPTKPFCEGSTAPICDDFANGASDKWMRRVSGSGTLDVESTEVTSPPSALRGKLTASDDASASAYALIEQQVTLPEATTYLYLNARVQTRDANGNQGGVRALRVDSRGLPAILVIADDTAFLATQDLMGITQLGKQFVWTARTWHAISLQFTRTPGIGATVQLFLDGELAAEGSIATFDSPYLVQIGPYRETAAFGADIIYDDVTLLAK